MTQEVIKGTLSDPLYVASERARDTFSCIKQERGGGGGRRRYKSSTYSEPKYKKVFYKVAEICASRGWDVSLYVRTAFDIFRKNHNYVTPRDLTESKMIDAFYALETCGELTRDPRHRYTMQVKELLKYLQLKDGLCTEDAVLYSPLTPFESWFRVLYPENTSNRIFDIYGDIARQELAEDAALRAFARQRFPRMFKELERRTGYFGDVSPVMEES